MGNGLHLTDKMLQRGGMLEIQEYGKQGLLFNQGFTLGSSNPPPPDIDIWELTELRLFISALGNLNFPRNHQRSQCEPHAWSGRLRGRFYPVQFTRHTAGVSVVDDSGYKVANGIFHLEDFVPHPPTMGLSLDVKSCRALPSQAEIRRLFVQAQGDDVKLMEIKNVLAHFKVKVYLPGQDTVEDPAEDTGPAGMPRSTGNVNVLNDRLTSPE